MRAPVPSSSWLKLTSFERAADVMRTGTETSPKLIDPLHTALGTANLHRDETATRSDVRDAHDSSRRDVGAPTGVLGSQVMTPRCTRRAVA
jgi:hypothetical protein